MYQARSWVLDMQVSQTHQAVSWKITHMQQISHWQHDQSQVTRCASFQSLPIIKNLPSSHAKIQGSNLTLLSISNFVNSTSKILLESPDLCPSAHLPPLPGHPQRPPNSSGHLHSALQTTARGGPSQHKADHRPCCALLRLCKAFLWQEKQNVKCTMWPSWGFLSGPDCPQPLAHPGRALPVPRAPSSLPPQGLTHMLPSP